VPSRPREPAINLVAIAFKRQPDDPLCGFAIAVRRSGGNVCFPGQAIPEFLIAAADVAFQRVPTGLFILA
jgi:hypothetical protein